MKGTDRGHLIRVKRSALRHPVVVATGATSLAALLALNLTAFIRGMESPWLLGGVILADMLVIGAGIVVAAREVLTAEHGTAAAREAYEQTQTQLAAIVEWSDDAIIGMSLDGVIASWNRGAEKMYGYSEAEAIGKPVTIIIPAERQAEEGLVLERIARGEPMEHFETVRRAKDGRLLHVSLTVSPIRDVEGRVTGASKIARDITREREAQASAERLRHTLDTAQARLAAIVDSAMDAVITVDAAQRIVLFNRAAEQVFALSRDEAIGSPLERFIPARFRGAHHAHVEQFGRTGVTSRRMGDVTTLWALRADGTEFPIEASISQAVESGERYYTVILRDITVRKRYEDELKRQQQELRELSARVLEAREEEKTLIARELHDELGQLLTALKMDLASLRERLGGDAELAKRADEMGRMLDQTVTATRRISADLRPLMLDDLGLADASAWLVDDFAKRSGIHCDYRGPGDGALDDLAKPAATAVYRALQESLTNIGRHAGAKNAWIVLGLEQGMVNLEIEDDGRGISAADIAKSRSLGLKGMRERVAYLGGSFEVARAARGGTRVRVRVPPRPAAQEATA